VIKRSYFYCVKWMAGDGTKDYACVDGVVVIKSLFSVDGFKLIEYVREDAKKECSKAFPSGHPEVVSLNRI